MKLDHLPSEFVKALPILRKIQSAGYEAYFVGGSVRDALLGRPIHDVDIATSSYPQETKAIFQRTVDIGIEHGTVLVLEEEGEYEITTFRTEDTYVDYRRPSSVSFVRSLDEDLRRRDFTVNAFALDEAGTIIDQFGGLSDLDNEILRAVGNPSERFHEDALRIMRGFRFAASLDFTIEIATFRAMCEHAHLLEKISIERSFIEMDKLLLAPHWRKGLSVLLKSGATAYLPELSKSREGLERLLADLDAVTTFSSSEQAWAALLLALEVSEPHSFLKKWKTSTQFQKDVATIIAIYRQRLTSPIEKLAIYQNGRKLIEQAEEIRRFKGLETDFERINQLDETLAIRTKQDIHVNGGLLIRELGFKPGPQLGQVLKAIEKAIVLDELPNNKEAIINFIKRRSYE